MPDGKDKATIKEIYDFLRQTYCGSTGIEIAHLDLEEREFLTDYVESNFVKWKNELSDDKKVSILKDMIESEEFDLFMQKKFPAVKRYSLEGTESLIPLLRAIFESAGKEYDSVVMSMHHRGRLNTLVNLLNYDAAALFSRLRGNPNIPDEFDANDDVLSHVNQSTELEYANNLHVSLINNPSHLEAACPVAIGKTYARKKVSNEKSMTLLVHGDASFVGQGVSYESLTLAALPSYGVNGVVHVIVNNRLGFTAAKNDGRASKYASDLGKLLNLPVFHVNATQPSDIIAVVNTAMMYKNKFNKDVIIDLIGWRKHGHNELDEPRLTQPLLYKTINEKKTSIGAYMQQLLSSNIITKDMINDIKNDYQKKLLDRFQASVTPVISFPAFTDKWSKFKQPKDMTLDVDTGIDKDVAVEIGKASVNTSNINIHRRLKRYFVKKRLDSFEKNEFDWSTAETLAIGSLLRDGYDVRLSGQDVGRGTFSHRHFTLYDQETGERYMPLNHLENRQGELEVANSFLSEFAVLGFEYGYSIEDPNALVIWEAQFGDFANGAQIIIDNFISSSEEKWLRQTGIVLSLPHGYEATGPEHSSSRIERFLQLCDSDALNDTEKNKTPNMRVIFPTTPANCFHMLRRQMITEYRRPLVVIGPKILLHHPRAVSSLDDIAPGTSFKKVIGDSKAEENPENVDTLIFCTGKVVYDLLQMRDDNELGDNVSIIRLEELVPFPSQEIRKELNKYINAKNFIWFQEEPQNMGAFLFSEIRFRSFFNIDLKYVGQGPLAAAALGTAPLHKKEYSRIKDILKDNIQESK